MNISFYYSFWASTIHTEKFLEISIYEGIKLET